MPLSSLRGRQLMLCDVIYQRGSKKTDWKDYLNIVYRDMVTGKKEIFTIEEPTIDIFVVKEEYRDFKKPRHFIEKDKVDVKTVKYKDVLWEIAKLGGEATIYFYKNHSQKERRDLYKYPYVLGADVPIETYYRCLWNEQVGNCDKVSIHKAYLDIEVDQINFEGNIAKDGECPVNAVTIIDDTTDISYTFLYDDGNNPQIKDFVNNQDAFQKRLHEEFDEDYGVLTYKIYMFDNELEMLIQLFRLIKTICPDFVLIWNMGYDIPYLESRLKRLGVDPASIMCDNSFPTDSLYYYKDFKSFEWANKRDSFTVSAKTHYSDQLINYAALRKSQGAVKRVNLDYVAKKEIGVGKVGYSDVATIRTLPYVDYILFVIYNIGDVLSQRGIERKVRDVNNLYLISTTNNIGYTDALKQTVTFRGLMFTYLRKIGYVLGHNVNFGNETHGKYDENGDLLETEEEDEGFEGAINGDPMLNLENGIKIFGAVSRFLYKFVVDFDFSSMYPNSIVAFNIFATTMIGKLYILNHELKNPYDKDMGKEYIEDIIAGDLNHIGEKWHNLSPIENLAQKVKETYF